MESRDIEITWKISKGTAKEIGSRSELSRFIYGLRFLFSRAIYNDDDFLAHASEEQMLDRSVC